MMTPEEKDRLKLTGDLIALLVQATINDDWGEMQRAQKRLLLVYTDLAQLRNAVKLALAGFDATLTEPHCAKCHMLKSRHANQQDGVLKCLFEATTFSPCDVILPPVAVGHLIAKNKIAAIKEIRTWNHFGLKKAKDLCESEMRRHGW